MRGLVMFPVCVHTPVRGSYNSALASVLQTWLLHTPIPPATRTLLFASTVAVWLLRIVFIEPVAVQFPVFGSYSSAAFVPVQRNDVLQPPAARTRPLNKRDAVCSALGMIML